MRSNGEGGGFRASVRVLASVSFAFVAATAVLAEEPRSGDPGPDTAGVVPGDPATVAALWAFERHVNRIHTRQVARVETRDESTAPAATQAYAGDAPPEKAPAVPETPRLHLRGVLDRMSVSTRWQVEQDSWRAGIRLRYSRSVEFDPATQSYALIEAIEITPSGSFRIVELGRSTRVVVRRTGYGTWDAALLAAPSRWLFLDRPNRSEEAQRLASGTAVTVSNETRLFVGADVSTDVGALPLRARAGPFASGEYFVRLERLPESAETSDGREWTVSVGGLIPRGLESAMTLRTPDLLGGKRLRIVEARWRYPRGVRFLLRAGPFDLRSHPETGDFLRVALGGVAPFRFADARLLGASIRAAGPRSELGPKLLEKMERFPNFRRVLASAGQGPGGIPYSESLSRFTPRAHGDAGTGFWAFLYGFDLTANWYAEESLAAPSGRPSSMIDSYPSQRRWDRGWLFFPRETQDVQMITVQDATAEDLFTEVSLEIEDARAHRRESRTYRAQILSFITTPVAGTFPQQAASGAPHGPLALRGVLPDLSRAPDEDERVSIYLRIILGPRFHDGLLLGAKDQRERRDRITAWQKRISATIRRRGDTLEELVRACGAEDLFVSYRIALTPYSRRTEIPRPTTVFTGAYGDPLQIPSYRRLRDTVDAAGTVY